MPVTVVRIRAGPGCCAARIAPAGVRVSGCPHPRFVDTGNVVPPGLAWWVWEGGVMGFFEVSRGARRRARIRATLPTEHPAVLDADGRAARWAAGSGGCCAPSSGPGRWRRLAAIGNRLDAYLTAVAGAADTHGDSRVLGAGTTGTLVAAATGSTVAGRVGDRGHRPGPAGVPGVGPGVRRRPGVRPARVGDPGHHARSEAAGAGGGRGGGAGRGHRPAGNPACAASHRRRRGRRARPALPRRAAGPPRAAADRPGIRDVGADRAARRHRRRPAGRAAGSVQPRPRCRGGPRADPAAAARRRAGRDHRGRRREPQPRWAQPGCRC